MAVGFDAQAAKQGLVVAAKFENVAKYPESRCFIHSQLPPDSFLGSGMRLATVPSMETDANCQAQRKCIRKRIEPVDWRLSKRLAIDQIAIESGQFESLASIAGDETGLMQTFANAGGDAEAMTDSLSTGTIKPLAAPPQILERYDIFYLEQLRNAIREDHAATTFGKPSYRNHIADIVAKYGHNVIKTDSLTYQNLANFMAGVNPNPYLVRILDVYMQIVKGDIRARFFEERYVQVLGDNFADFLGIKTGVSDDFCDALCGLYQQVVPNIVIGNSEGFFGDGSTAAGLSRYLFIRRFSSARYLVCYEFTAGANREAEKAVSRRRMIAGFIIPNERYSVVLMRTLRDQVHRAGMLYYSFAEDRVSEVSLRARDFYDFEMKREHLSRSPTRSTLGGLNFEVGVRADGKIRPNLEQTRIVKKGKIHPRYGDDPRKGSDEDLVMKSARTETVMDFISIKPTDTLSIIVASFGGIL